MRSGIWGLVLISPVSGFAARARGDDLERKAYQWLSVPIQVTMLGSDAEFVPVSFHVDFSEMVKKLGADGVVDEHWLRLYRVTEGRETAEAVQFTCDSQPRARAKLPDTAVGVRYLGE